MKYKFVSSGQNVDDAAVVSQTLQGNSLKIPPPANIRGERNQAADLLALWTRRSRVAGGMIPGSDVPLGEERAEFELEVYSGSTLLRTIRNLFVGNPMGAVLETDQASKFADITGNTIVNGSAGAKRFRSLQTITQGENFIEATLYTTGSSEGQIHFGLLNTSKDWRTAAAADSDYRVTLEFDAIFNTLTAYQGSTSLYTEDATAYFSTGVRIRIELGAGEVRFFKNYAGPGSQPMAVEV